MYYIQHGHFLVGKVMQSKNNSHAATCLIQLYPGTKLQQIIWTFLLVLVIIVDPAQNWTKNHNNQRKSKQIELNQIEKCYDYLGFNLIE